MDSIRVIFSLAGTTYRYDVPFTEVYSGKNRYALVSGLYSISIEWDNAVFLWALTVDYNGSDWRVIYIDYTDSEFPISDAWIFNSGDFELDSIITLSTVPPHTNILASGISNVDHLSAFDAMVEQRFANLDIESVIVYLIDTVDASALPSLAAQFDVLGYKGYGLAQTEQQKRDVIKRAIELHRYKGTPWSIKEALRAIGYYDATIQERLINQIYYEGAYNHNGSQVYGPGHWADFRVKIDLGNDQGVTAQSASDAVALILEYKNARSRLRDVSYESTLVEYVTDTTEEFTLNIEIANSDAVGYYHDNTYLYGGSITYGTITENITT